MSKAKIAGLLAAANWFNSFNDWIDIKSNHGESIAYKPKRKKLKGYQKKRK